MKEELRQAEPLDLAVTDTSDSPPSVSRRRFLGVAAGLVFGGGVAALSGCGENSSGEWDDDGWGVDIDGGHNGTKPRRSPTSKSTRGGSNPRRTGGGGSKPTKNPTKKPR